MQKLFLLILFTFSLQILSTPVPCAQGAGILETESDILSAEGLSVHCPPKFTCEHTCSCSKNVYFNIRTLSGYHSWKSKWQQYCKREDPDDWAKDALFSANQKIRNMNARLSLMQIINKFRNLCKTGQKPTNSDMKAAFDRFEMEVKDMYGASADRSSVVASGRYIMNQFAAKVATQQFGYCSCSAFAQSIGQGSSFNSAANKVCQKKCGSGSGSGSNTPPKTTCRKVRTCSPCKYVRVKKYKCNYFRGRRSCGFRYVTQKQCPGCKYVTKCYNTLEEDTAVEEIITFE